MNQNKNSLRFYTSNNRPKNYLSNHSDISQSSNQKIMTLEKNLNDLKLETETEFSKQDEDFSYDGLKKQIDEISQNIFENDKKVMSFAQQNIENSKRIRQASLHGLKINLPSNLFTRTEAKLLSPERNFNYHTPLRTNRQMRHNIHSINYNNYMNNKISRNYIKDLKENDFFDDNNKNMLFSTNNFYNNNHFNSNDYNSYYNQNLNLNLNSLEPDSNRRQFSQKTSHNNRNIIQKGYIKQKKNYQTKSNRTENKLNELKNELHPLKADISILIKDINSLKAENQKLLKENEEYKSQNKILNDSLVKTKNNYSNELKTKEILIKELGLELQKLKNKINNIKNSDNNNIINKNTENINYNSLRLENNDLMQKNKELNIKINELLNKKFVEEEKNVKSSRRGFDNFGYQKELQSLQDEYDKLFNDNIKLNEENKKLNNELNEVQDEREEYKISILKMKELLEVFG